QFIVRLRPGTPVGPFRAAATRTLASLAPGMAPPRFVSVAAQAEKSWANLRLVLVLLGCFAALGVIVAGLGVYAGAAQMAAARRREMGIRIALGARPEQIRALVLARSARLALWALPAGVFAAWALARGLTHWLFRVRAMDPVSYAAAAALLMALAFLAALWPAHRAAQADPVAALRDDG
ncbi:MAG: FtsX-like permease family protein, partial [Terriglobales bacterium]